MSRDDAALTDDTALTDGAASTDDLKPTDDIGATSDAASPKTSGSADRAADGRGADDQAVAVETHRGDLVPNGAVVPDAGLTTTLDDELDDELVVLAVPWGLPFCLGVLSLGFGAAVLTSSRRGLLFFALLVGAWLFTTGATRVTAAIVARETSTVVELTYSALVGSLALVAGVLSLRGLVTDVVLVMGSLAIAWLLAGFADLMLAAAGLLGSGWLAVSGVLGLAVGVGFLLLPDDLMSVAVPLAGTTALFAGVVWVVVALGARSSSRRAQHWYRSSMGVSTPPPTRVPDGWA